MLLYEVPNRSWITIEGQRLFFDHIDGMYSYCLTENKEVVHLSAVCEVEVEAK